MFTLDIPDDVLEKLKNMLEGEDEGTCIRLREYTLGSG